MAARYWIKLYLEILDDPKMGRLPDYLFRRAIELFLAAGENGNDGALQPVPQLAWRLRLDETKLSESLRALSEVGVVYEAEPGKWIVTNFQKRQDAATSTERSREYRKRNDYATERCETCNDFATKQTYTEAEEESESDTESESSTTATTSRAENFENSNFPKGRLIDDQTAIRIYTAVTGHTVPPSNQTGPIIEAVIALCGKLGGAQETARYLQRYWQAWKARNYSPTNAAWLTDWAVTETIPEKRSKPVEPVIQKHVPPANRQAAAQSKLREMLEVPGGQPK